jgi:hypothetical protein
MRKEKASDSSKRLDRRHFLKGAGLALGAAGAATAATASGTVAATDDRKTPQAGYRETEHVRTYYRAARF